MSNVLSCAVFAAVLTLAAAPGALGNLPLPNRVNLSLEASPECLGTGALVVYASPAAGSVALGKGLDGFSVALTWDKNRLRLEAYSKDLRYTTPLPDVSDDQGLMVSAGSLGGKIPPDQPLARFVFTKVAGDCVSVTLTGNTDLVCEGLSVKGELESLGLCPCLTPGPTAGPTTTPQPTPTAGPTTTPQPTLRPTTTPHPTQAPSVAPSASPQNASGGGCSAGMIPGVPLLLLPCAFCRRR